MHHLHLHWRDAKQADPLVRPAHKLIFLVLDRPSHAAIVGIVEFLAVHVLIRIVHRWIAMAISSSLLAAAPPPAELADSTILL